jgi:hypothetical protein
MKKFIALLMVVAFITIGGAAFAGGDQNCHDHNCGDPDGAESGPTTSHQNNNSNPEDKPGP